MNSKSKTEKGHYPGSGLKKEIKFRDNDKNSTITSANFLAQKSKQMIHSCRFSNTVLVLLLYHQKFGIDKQAIKPSKQKDFMSQN